MSVIDRQQAMLERQLPGSLFTCLAADKDVFFFEDGALGSIMVGNFLTGADGKTQKMLQNMMQSAYPAGTILQDIQLGSPDLRENLDPYLAKRIYADGGNRVARAGCEQRAKFIEAAANQAIAYTVNTTVMDTRHFVTLKVPTKGLPLPRDGEINAFRELRDKLISMYQSASIELTPLPAAGYIAVMRRYFNMFGGWDYSYDESDLIRNQFLPPSARLKSRLKTVRVDRDGDKGSQHIGILTVKNYPKRANITIMDLMRGNPDGMGTQIAMPYALTTTIHFPDQSSKIGKVRAKGVLITQQSFGNMIRWVPILAAKKHGFDVLGSALDEGDNAVEACTTLMLFHPDKREVGNLMTNLEQLYSSYAFGMAPERYIVWPSIYNSLPLCPSPDSIENTHRFKTMGSRHAAQFLPVIDEWRGYGDAMILTTRRGRPFGYDFFHDQNNNYNWLLIAASGAGKSFAVQRITQDYLSVGTKMWIVDKGRSHAKFTKAHQGELIEFTEIAHCSLNPFSKVIDIDEDIGILVALLGKMCNPDTQTDAADAVRIMEAIKSTWTTYGSKMEITHVYRYLNAQHTDERSVEMARRLYPFTMEGPYGSWFRGPSTLETNSQLTTLELSALGGKKHLQQVILQLLVINVEQAMYRSHDGVKKMLLVEEGGDLLREPGFSTFLAQLYSKVRKEEGSVGLVLQSLAQLIDSGRDGISIMGSAATRIIMEQEAEAIDTARRQDWMSISEGEAHLLKSVHTVQGKAGYSEMYFRTPNGSGIARLVESRFNQVLFSTKGPEFKGILAAVDAGQDVAKAVHQFIADEAIA